MYLTLSSRISYLEVVQTSHFQHPVLNYSWKFLQCLFYKLVQQIVNSKIQVQVNTIRIDISIIEILKLVFLKTINKR